MQTLVTAELPCIILLFPLYLLGISENEYQLYDKILLLCSQTNSVAVVLFFPDRVTVKELLPPVNLLFYK